MTGINVLILGGFSATLLLTLVIAVARGMGWTRMDIPFMVGTVVTGQHSRSIWIGVLLHFFNGWVFSIVHFAIFSVFRWNAIYLGGLTGIIHALFVLTVGLYLLPSFHPRMASENDGPEPTPMLEPPGFLALNYGHLTPTVSVLAHLVYGIVLGLFWNAYTVS